MARIDQLLADFMKGAQQAGAQVEMPTAGREEKLAELNEDLEALYTDGQSAALEQFKIAANASPKVPGRTPKAPVKAPKAPAKTMPGNVPSKIQIPIRNPADAPGEAGVARAASRRQIGADPMEAAMQRAAKRANFINKWSKESSLLGAGGALAGTLLAGKLPGAGKALHTAASMGAGMAGQAVGDHISNKLSPPR